MIVGILGPGGCGGTFLDWTLQYLSGQSDRWAIRCDPLNRANIISQQPEKILENPIIKKTAHLHKKTHPNDYSIDEVISIFNLHPEFNFHSFYYVDSIGNSRKHTNYNQIIASYPDLKFITYNFTEDDLDVLFCFQYEKIPMKEFDACIMTNSSIPIGEMPVWDRRELLSLYYPGLIRGQTIVEQINPASNNFNLNFSKALTNLDDIIDEILAYVELIVDSSRLKSWKNVYNDWKNKNNLLFYNELETIIYCILNNVDHDLTRYDMSFAKEVVIASKLLYNYNLALKSYNKPNLSHNTQQWTEILEPNLYHDLSKN